MASEENQTSSGGGKDQLMDHQFDGIQEFDNPIPLWMSIIFVGSILFSIVYMVYYHGLGMGDLPGAAYEKEMAAYESFKAERAANQPAVDLAALVNDAAAIEAGHAVYMSTCASCHGNQAEGLVGPSFLDTLWRQGDGSIESIVEIAKNGIVEKGMPPWGHIGDEKIHQVSAFIYSLSHGNDIFAGAVPMPDPIAEAVAGGAVPAATGAVASPAEVATEGAAGSAAAPADELAAAKQMFGSVCIACHGADGKGEGLPGADLTDDQWAYGDGTVAAIQTTIWDGIPAKGMPPWSSLGKETVEQLARYVHSFSNGS